MCVFIWLGGLESECVHGMHEYLLLSIHFVLKMYIFIFHSQEWISMAEKYWAILAKWKEKKCQIRSEVRYNTFPLFLFLWLCTHVLFLGSSTSKLNMFSKIGCIIFNLHYSMNVLCSFCHLCFSSDMSFFFSFHTFHAWKWSEILWMHMHTYVFWMW